MITNLLSFGGKILTVGGNALSFSSVDPYNPLNLPPYTVRLKFNDGVTPTFSKGTATQVSSSPNVWDLTYENANWNSLLTQQYNLLEILGANSTGVTSMSFLCGDDQSLASVALFDTSACTALNSMFANCFVLQSIPMFDTHMNQNMSYMFYVCETLTSIPLLDTSNVTNFSNAFFGASGLLEIPLFDTRNVTNFYRAFEACNGISHVPLLDTSAATEVNKMFCSCLNVEEGALDMYQQMISQAQPPASHSYCFDGCGAHTTSGQAELAQIPSSWGGTGS